MFRRDSRELRVSPTIRGQQKMRMGPTNPHTARISVIALTAHAMAGDRQHALAAGCDEFETKPIEFPRLLAKIAALVASGEGAE